MLMVSPCVTQAPASVRVQRPVGHGHIPVVADTESAGTEAPPGTTDDQCDARTAVRFPRILGMNSRLGMDARYETDLSCLHSRVEA